MTRTRTKASVGNRRTRKTVRNRRLKQAQKSAELSVSGARAAKTARRGVKKPDVRSPAKKAPEARRPGGGGSTLETAVRWARWLGRPLGALLLLAGVVYGGVLAHRFVVRSPHFQVRKVIVSPTVHVSAGEVRKLAGISQRTNIFTVDLEAVAAKVRRHPWIASATALRRMPNAIRIEVREHEASAAVLVHGSRPGQSRFYLVDVQGRAFKRAVPAELEGLALITGISRTEYLRHRASSTARIRDAIQVYGRYLAQPGRPRIGEIHVDPVEGITLYTARRAVQVRFGRGHIAAKLRRFDRVVTELARRGQRAAAIRLDNERHPRQVTVRLAEAEVNVGRPQ
ncbi:MAG: FtsQ-type POTRA domain-containing protein [bacterium]